MLYRALKEYLNVPTELCEYPNQPHGLGTLSFRTAKMEWDLAWFAKYLNK
jgi:dipeptidyl aminopeptidase/acylaminoacyl peptidase